jgi:hypothetical protein
MKELFVPPGSWLEMLSKEVSGQNPTSPVMLRWIEQQPELRPMWVVAKVYGTLRKNKYYSKLQGAKRPNPYGRCVSSVARLS